MMRLYFVPKTADHPRLHGWYCDCCGQALKASVLPGSRPNECPRCESFVVVPPTAEIESIAGACKA
jgi:hypothetical protein